MSESVNANENNIQSTEYTYEVDTTTKIEMDAGGQDTENMLLVTIKDSMAKVKEMVFGLENQVSEYEKLRKVKQLQLELELKEQQEREQERITELRKANGIDGIEQLKTKVQELIEEIGNVKDNNKETITLYRQSIESMREEVEDISQGYNNNLQQYKEEIEGIKAKVNEFTSDVLTMIAEKDKSFQALIEEPVNDISKLREKTSNIGSDVDKIKSQVDGINNAVEDMSNIEYLLKKANKKQNTNRVLVIIAIVVSLASCAINVIDLLERFGII